MGHPLWDFCAVSVPIWVIHSLADLLGCTFLFPPQLLSRWLHLQPGTARLPLLWQATLEIEWILSTYFNIHSIMSIDPWGLIHSWFTVLRTGRLPPLLPLSLPAFWGSFWQAPAFRNDLCVWQAVVSVSYVLEPSRTHGRLSHSERRRAKWPLFLGIPLHKLYLGIPSLKSQIKK